MARVRNWTPWAGAGIGLTIGLLVGWGIATFLVCGEACVFNVALFEALGTWVGGVLIAGVGATYAIYRTRRDTMDALLHAEAEALARARDCTIRFKPLGDASNGYSQVAIEFLNKLDERVFDVELLDEAGSTIRRDAQVAPGRGWGDKIPLESLGLASNYPSQRAVSIAIKGRGRDSIVFCYSIHGFRFERTGNEIKVVGRPRRAQRSLAPIIG